MPKADGSVLIITEIDSDGVTKGTKKMKGTLEDLGKDSQSAGKEISGGLADSFKKLGAVIAAAGIVDKIADVSKEAINLGSDLQEVQNVVDVTFSTMSDRVDEFAKAAAASAGLSETMAKKYVGTFGAMADSFGFAEAEAYEMSTALTQLTGDVASFYNMSQDEAYTKLKSVFTGETESLKELGVVMTQTALDAYALANGFGKVTADMTEQEKVALRYQFVMEQLSGASGDFVRTQEGWANQTRVLQLKWESLLAVLGGGLIQALTPFVQLLNEDILPALTDLAKKITEAFEPSSSKKLERSIKQLENSVSDANAKFDESQKTIEKNALMASRYADRLKDLEKTGLDTAESQREYANVVSYLNSIYPELNLRIDEETGLLDALSRSRLRNIDAMKQEALYRAQEERYTAILEAQADTIYALHEAEYARVGVQEELSAVTQKLQKLTGKSADELKNLYNNQKIANSYMRSGATNADAVSAALQVMGIETNSLTAEEMELVEQMILLSTEEEALTREINNCNSAISAQDSELEKLGEITESTAEKQGDMVDAADETAGAVNNLSDAYDDAGSSAEKSVELQIGLFDKLETKSEMTAEQIVQNWRDQQAAFSSYSDNLQKAIDTGFSEELVKALSDGSQESMIILNELVNSMDMSVEEMNAIFEERMMVGDLVEIQMARANGASAEKLQAMLDDYRKKWPQMTDVVKKEIAEIQKEIDTLSGKTFYIKTKTSTSTGNHYYEDFGEPAAVTDSAPIPMLAAGAVIPPNAPFLAMLGDQKSGTNIEAPLETIKQALSEVIAEGGFGGDINLVLTGDLAQLARVLNPHIDSERSRKGASLAKVVVVNG